MTIGETLGNDIGQLTAYAYAHGPALIAFVMAGLRAAVTRAPMTSLISVMAMLNGHALVLRLVPTTSADSGVSPLIRASLYNAPAELQLPPTTAPRT